MLEHCFLSTIKTKFILQLMAKDVTIKMTKNILKVKND